MKPLFSVITPVYNPPQYAFEKCVETVFAQEFKDWEWCLVDDCSTAPWIKKRLNELQALDQRIKVYFRSENGGIVAASNDAISLASGEFIVLLDNDDELHLDALKEVATCIDENPNTDYIYSNEDKITEDGEHFDEFVKPDWSPERFLSQNYCSHLSVIRTTLINQVGRFRTGFDGAQDYDLFLRITEQTKNIVHIPKVLYHWRAVPGSTASANNAKLYAYSAAAKAVDEHLKRRKIAADVTFDNSLSLVTVKRRVISHPKVSIIIPTCGTRKSIFGVDTCLVVNAVESIERKSSYTNFEIIVIVDKGTPQQVITDLKAVCPNRLKIIDYDKPFNFSDKCNVGVVNSDAPLILMLNDDTEIISPDWLETMVGHISDEDVAMVGPLLLFEDGRIQSAGHSNTHSLHNFCAGSSNKDFGHFRMLKLPREVSGVTGACALIKRDAYFEVGGMSEIFPLAFNDCDLAFKFLEHGYRIIWTPNARLFHFESATRPANVKPSEVKAVMSRWGRKINNDEYCKIH